jgi:hypothetical protein
MSVCKRVMQAISVAKNDVFFRQDFLQFGSPSQVARALKRLISEGLIVRISLGVYAPAKISVLTGKPIPMQPISVLAPKVLQRFGIEARPSRLVREYNEGKSTQLPANGTVNIGKKRTNRKIGFGRSQIKYETD